MATQNMKMGLIAFGIVFGAGLVVGTVLLVASPGSKGKGKSDPTTAEQAIVAGDYSHLQNHRWWSRPLTEKEIGAILQKISATNQGGFLWARQDGTTVHESAKDQPWYDEQVYVYPPSMKGKKHLHCKITGDRRLTIEEAAKLLGKELDRAEFAQGAGR